MLDLHTERPTVHAVGRFRECLNGVRKTEKGEREMLNQRHNADRWIERTLRQAVEGRLCTECGDRPVSARPFDFERQICRPCGQAIEQACKRSDRNRRESQRLVGRANTPDDPRTPRYVTWKGWVIGFHSDDGQHMVWGAYPQYSGEGVSKLPKGTESVPTA